jgi:hypothetical protein
VDIQEEYINYRKNGKNRAETIELLRHEYSGELQDDDDRLAVLIGLSLALCNKNELIDSIAIDTMTEITRAKCENEDISTNEKIMSDLAKLEICLKDKSVYGGEAKYRKSRKYIPDWQVGDVFSHVMTSPGAEELGIKGWHILIYKVGEYEDTQGDLNQLVFVALCPPEKIPSDDEGFQKLTFLPMMFWGKTAEYLAQITIKSKKTEEKYELSKIGHVSKINIPPDSCERNPSVSMPLFEKLSKDDLYPSYEGLICRLYKARKSRSIL